MNLSQKNKDINVQLSKNFKNVDISLPRLKKLVKGICQRFDIAHASVSIAVVNDAEIRKLNSRFLGRNDTTDCLSFDLSDDQNPPLLPKARESRQTRRKGSRLFELVVNGQKAIKEAKSRGHAAEAELALYVTHAMLHNLGFNDSTQSGAEHMHQTEDMILKQFGYGPVYDSKAGLNS